VRCRRRRPAGNSSIYSRPPKTTPSTPPISAVEIRQAMTAERSDLSERWEQDGTVDAELTRVALNADWTLSWMTTSSSRWVSTLRQTGQLRSRAIEQAVWMATPEDLDSYNTFDRDPDREPFDATRLRSGWFST
jgi:hypothetical protein